MVQNEKHLITTLSEYNNRRYSSKDQVDGKEFRRLKRKAKRNKTFLY